MANTKIVVLHRRELLYTGIFLSLLFVFILLSLILFFPRKQADTKEQAKYVPGVYTSSLNLNDTELNLEVVVDQNHINSVSITNIDESVSAMYPLLEPSLSEIEKQLSNNIPLSEIQVTEDGKYTQTLLLEHIQKALDLASNQ